MLRTGHRSEFATGVLNQTFVPADEGQYIHLCLVDWASARCIALYLTG